MRKRTLAATAAALALGLSACGDGDTGDEALQGSGQEGSAGGNGSAAEPFGPGCSDFPRAGPGSIKEMADQPFASAIDENPVLGNLADALDQAGLSEDMDTSEGITVFAPTDDAFDMYPDEEVEDLLEDPDALAYVLNNHVVAGGGEPGELDDGMFDALNGGQVRVSESGGEYTVNDYAPVVCANIQTANATVHAVSMLVIPS